MTHEMPKENVLLHRIRFVLFVLLAVLTGCASLTNTEEEKLPTPPAPMIPTTVPTRAVVTPSPSASPLTKDAIASCLVSLPNVVKSPHEHYVSTINGYQNDAGTLFTMLPSAGIVIFSPHGPGRIFPDGSMGIKWPWYRTIPGEVIINGRRLDAPAPPMPTIILRGKPDGYGETGFHPSGLIFPSEGCWEVTARVSDVGLTFVTLVIRIPFDILQPAWFPDGLILPYTSPDVTDLPRSIGIVHSSPDGGTIRFETIQGLQENDSAYPETAIQQVTVNGQPGVCVKGAWNTVGQWQPDADAGLLAWNASNLSYQIRYTGLTLSCEDLLRMAGSS